MYVVRPVRWLYSLVIDKIAMIGSTTESGMPIAVEKVSSVIASSGAQRITAAVARTDDDADAGHQPEAGAGVEHLAQLDPGEAASSGSGATARGRVRAPASTSGEGGVGWWWSCCCSFASGVGGELEEHLLQAGAVGGAQLAQDDAGTVCGLAHELGFGVDAQAAVDRGW